MISSSAYVRLCRTKLSMISASFFTIETNTILLIRIPHYFVTYLYIHSITLYINDKYIHWFHLYHTIALSCFKSPLWDRIERFIITHTAWKNRALYSTIPVIHTGFTISFYLLNFPATCKYRLWSGFFCILKNILKASIVSKLRKDFYTFSTLRASDFARHSRESCIYWYFAQLQELYHLFLRLILLK